jgi:predicted SAM-dependent methyltransferase
MSEPIKLHIGGTQAKEGWKILNIIPGPIVDITGSCTDLSLFADASVDEIYASHVMEHLPFAELIRASREMARVLKPGGILKGSVPNLDILFRLFLENAGDAEKQMNILFMIYGGHVDEFDIHHCGFNFEIMAGILAGSGFSRIDQVELHHEFIDTSYYRHDGALISLNFIATR